MHRVLILNGPNLDLLGIRQPEVYGRTTLADLTARLERWGDELSIATTHHQSNHEGELVEWVHQARGTQDAIVINAGALTHYSLALADALSSVDLPVVEVHISNVLEREAWRRHSVVGPVAVKSIYGRGLSGYRWALRHLVNRTLIDSTPLPYGPLADQVGDLRRPGGKPRALVILIHGGLWRHEWTLDTTEGIAVDLTRAGYLTWNLEYRRIGTGGGWPESFQDVAAALAAAASLTGIGLEQTAVLGHSAGGSMALWTGGLPPNRRPALTVGLAAMPDLVRAHHEGLGEGSVARLLGRRRPSAEEYSPRHRFPAAPALLGVALADALVPLDHPREFVRTAREAGNEAELFESEGNHWSLLDSGHPAWGGLAGRLRARIPPL